ncbi:class I SAM-dependent methyltransferase [Lysobacter korlensis]|uniref:Class I SAM-dependent methyltransferase n=1 Tax=Lysobacter korlensis TaxID=553636 RepID=A0ABV6RNN3_9GAMM
METDSIDSGTMTTATAADADAFADRVLNSTLGLIDMLSIYLGDRLGWYRALADAGDGGMDAAGLAASTGTQERYATEWLEQQAVTGILGVDGGDSGPRRFVLPAGPREVLADPDSLSYMAPIARMFGASMAQLPALVRAYRTGGGVSWEQLGDDARESQADVNRPLFEQRLAPALGGSQELTTLLSKPGARIADVGCGLGWSTLALARAYPEASLVGIDIDEPSIARAKEHATAAGVSGRVEFRAGDASSLGGVGAPASELAAEGEFDAAGLTSEGEFDAAFILEALHDMPHPVPVLRAVRSALTETGVLVVMDEAVADEFAPNGDEVERLMYGYSLLVCLPDSLSTPDSVGTGTVMRRTTLERYAREAGFSSVEVLPVEDLGFFRLYLLRP